MLTFTVPLPPRLNTLYHTTKQGGFYSSSEAKVYKRGVQLLYARTTPLDGPVRLDLIFYYPNNRSDIDSGLKVLLDALAGVFYSNDRQIVYLTVQKAVDKVQPRVEGSVTLALPAS